MEQVGLLREDATLKQKVEVRDDSNGDADRKVEDCIENDSSPVLLMLA